MNQLQIQPRRSNLRYIVPVLLAFPVVAIVVFLLVASSSGATITTNPTSLATIKMPLGGGSIVRIAAIGGKDQRVIPVTVRGDTVWPDKRLQQGEPVTIYATIKRPGWVSWVSGGTERVRITERTPQSHPVSTFVTRQRDGVVAIDFSAPVRILGSRPVGSKVSTHELSTATSSVKLSERAKAGSLLVAASPRAWEKATTSTISWFPSGSHATAVAEPAPGKTINSTTPITLRFSTTVAKALDGKLPPVTPVGSGSWDRVNAHTIQFRPSGDGYGLAAAVSVSLPSAVKLIGGSGGSIGKWTVPPGSTEQLQALLAELGYLPYTYNGQNYIGESQAEIERQIISPSAGSFGLRYADTPAALQDQWSPVNYTVVTKGAIMAFEYNNNLTVDGLPGPAVWSALIAAASKDQKSTFGYTFVFVHRANSNEWETTWHNGSDVVHGVVNTGAPGEATQLGTFPVFEHLRVTTMSGTNLNGTTYHDPGIQWVSYFNGGDALHEFPRASYGFPQSDGCVEMPLQEAGQVWPYTPIGTLVEVSTGI